MNAAMINGRLIRFDMARFSMRGARLSRAWRCVALAKPRDSLHFGGHRAADTVAGFVKRTSH